MVALLSAMAACGGDTPLPPEIDGSGGSGGSGSASGATCNNMGICKPGEPADCMFGSQGSGAACDGSTYDLCNTGSDCASGNCHLFQASGFSVCTVACTPGDNSTCPGGS